VRGGKQEKETGGGFFFGVRKGTAPVRPRTEPCTLRVKRGGTGARESIEAMKENKGAKTDPNGKNVLIEKSAFGKKSPFLKVKKSPVRRESKESIDGDEFSPLCMTEGPVFPRSKKRRTKRTIVPLGRKR